MVVAEAKKFGGETVVSDEAGRSSSPWELQRAVRVVHTKAQGVARGLQIPRPAALFRVSAIASGLVVKGVQTRLRYASVMTTLNTNGYMWQNAEESARAAVEVMLAARAGSLAKRFADSPRTRPG